MCLLATFLLALLAPQPDADSESPRHLIYLHGRIVQETQELRPEHPEYGPYELVEIVETLRARGLVVTPDLRPREATLDESADRVVARVRDLLEAGVPPERITILGASMGAAIALRAAARLQEPEVRFVVLGPCLAASVPALAREQNAVPAGRILAIRERSDEGGERCARWRESNRRWRGLRAREIVLDTGLGHGFLYRPLPEWVDPAVAWATAERVPE